MSVFYDKMAATASGLITKFGKQVTFKRVTGGSYDPVTGTETPGFEELFTTPGIWQTIKTQHIDGTLIQAGDKMLVIDASFTPAMTDTVLVGSAYWHIANIIEKSPAGTPLAYIVQVRK